MSEEEFKKCPYCAETIKKEAIVCRFCGRDLQESEVPSTSVSNKENINVTPPNPKSLSSQGAKSKKKNHKTRNTILIILAVIVTLCCIVGIISTIGKDTGNTLTDTIDNTSAQNTENKTSMPKPKTATPTIVLAPSMKEILDTTDGMTDAQREHYFDILRGNYVDSWQGTVSEVDEGEIFGGYTVYVEMEGGHFGNEVYLPVEEDVALSLSLNQAITFSGTIDYASDILYVSVKLKDVIIE